MTKARKTLIRSENSLKQATLKDVFYVFEKIINKYNEHSTKNISFVDCILETINKNTRENYIKILSTCNCCERHRINFPKQSNEKLPNINMANKINNSKNICRCPCRNYARFLVRTFNNQ
jgi:hypothetical protein